MTTMTTTNGATIELYEDNAGRLTLWDPQRRFGFAGLEQCPGSRFCEDAAAMVNGLTRAWTVQRIRNAFGVLVARWHDGVPSRVELVRAMGRAATLYVVGENDPRAVDVKR